MRNNAFTLLLCFTLCYFIIKIRFLQAKIRSNKKTPASADGKENINPIFLRANDALTVSASFLNVGPRYADGKHRSAIKTASSDYNIVDFFDLSYRTTKACRFRRVYFSRYFIVMQRLGLTFFVNCIIFLTVNDKNFF